MNKLPNEPWARYIETPITLPDRTAYMAPAEELTPGAALRIRTWATVLLGKMIL